MKKTYMILAALTASAAFLFTSCEVEKTQEGEMPEVDVDVKAGQLPKYEVDAPEVDVKMKTKTIEIEVPDVDVTLPKDKD